MWGGDFKNEKSSNITISNQFLKENPYLVLDTAFYSEDFKERLISSIDNLDDNINGVLIHGDNFQALNLLQEKYNDTIQCVYIDPPYNTGNDGFNYKDKYQHSSWLSMMYDRLDKTKPLMSDTGVFFSSIDENEVSNLKKLCDNIFYEENFIADFIRKTKSTTNDAKIGLNYQHEFLLSYAKYKNYIDLLGGEKDLSKYQNLDNDPNGEWVSGDPSAKSGTKENGYFVVKNPYTGKEDYPPIGMYWRFSKNTIQQHIDEGRICFKKEHGKNERGFIYKRYLKDLKSIQKTFDSLIFTDNKYMNQVATKELQPYGLVDYFTYPKSVQFIKQIFIHTINQEDTILDYFAGSGTTGHAVIDLNREDNGNRKYILVEMGEYFDTVTKPRIEKAIYSKDWKDGKPISREGSSHIFKYIRLESYEDTLNNISFNSSQTVESILNDKLIQEEYVIKYKIKKEAEKNSLYMPVELFYNPFNFKLNITKNNEMKEESIDLIETFNFLIGLNVSKYYKESYKAEFTNNPNERLKVVITQDINGEYIFKILEGVTRQGDKTLIIWRKIIGDISNHEDVNKNNAVLDEVYNKIILNQPTKKFDIIYINCNNNIDISGIQNGCKIVLIEEVMKEKLFETK